MSPKYQHRYAYERDIGTQRLKGTRVCSFVWRRGLFQECGGGTVPSPEKADAGR